ncbi:hypothetical protein PTTG_12582 [Puccinia triticina 1-1 BBBD Race 1]|uniref:Uncharacterized protein n=2 Tax=Puccinia triticina TaxID=208348 RepID=A0A180GIE3_PUCT1|nr:uncharacterized protein PtA15_18A408 [Puccinia triticina]OAV92092.1 hypothetical protein PTTG_12582 [Puccinia triticina 1-1 BBBD Race 1]WAQ93348.1 hypothetical protein PtA15_18A408 [Puccinia triticina]
MDPLHAQAVGDAVFTRQINLHYVPKSRPPHPTFLAFKHIILRMASKLLSCLIIAVSCHHAIGPFTAPPIPVDVVDIPRTSNLQQPEVFDFQRYAPYKTLLGQDMFEAKVAPGLPPDDVFPQGTRKNFVATHITRWMLDPKTQWPYSILCSESQAQWAYIGVVYNSLVKRWRLDVRNYLINNGIVVSAKDMINVKRIEWFMARANRPVWWNGDLIRALYRRENRLLLNEDVCLGRVGDILEFETEESSFKFKASFSDVFEKFAQLDKVFALHRRNTVERTGGGERDAHRDGQARQFADGRPGEPVDGVRADLQRQLAAVEYRALERVRLELQLGPGLFERRQLILEHDR